MKKIFTLLAATAMVLTASAQTAETWKPDGTEPKNKTVNLPSIKAEFLDNTSKGSNAGAGEWDFSKKSDVRGDENGLEIRFTPVKSGVLSITYAADVATNKSIHMEVNGDQTNTIPCTLPDGTQLESGAKPSEKIPAGESVKYDLVSGNYYNFYTNGTKWRLKEFSFIPSADQSAITDITADENAPVEYFNLQGVRVDNPSNGIFIKRQGSKVSKVVVK